MDLTFLKGSNFKQFTPLHYTLSTATPSLPLGPNSLNTS